MFRTLRALNRLKPTIRRLPVVSDGKLVGVFSLADIAKRRVFVDEAGDVLSALSSQLN